MNINPLFTRIEQVLAEIVRLLMDDDFQPVPVPVEIPENDEEDGGRTRRD